MAESCGHGRFSRPENFTMRAASHRLSTLVMVASTAAAGGMAATRKSISRSALDTPGTLSGASAGAPVSTRSMRVSALRRPARKLSASVPKLGMATTTTSAARIAAQTTSRPGGYHSSAAALPPLPAAPDAPASRDSRATRPEGRRRPGTRRRTRGRTRAPSASAPTSAAISAAQWLQPSPAIMIGSGAR